MRHPMQPIYVDTDGRHRFKKNAIVQFLLDNGKYDMNDLASLALFHDQFSDEDREQFAQLIGYSVSGFQELDYVSDEAWNEAQEKSEALKEGEGE